MSRKHEMSASSLSRAEKTVKDIHRATRKHYDASKIKGRAKR